MTQKKTKSFTNLWPVLAPPEQLVLNQRRSHFTFTQLIWSFLRRHLVAVTSQLSKCILNRPAGKQKHRLT